MWQSTNLLLYILRIISSNVDQNQFLIQLTVFASNPFVASQASHCSDVWGRHRIHDTRKWEVFRHVLGNTSCYMPGCLDAMFSVEYVIMFCKNISRGKKKYLVIVLHAQCTVFDLTKWRRVGGSVAKFLHIPILQHHLLAIADYPSKRGWIWDVMGYSRTFSAISGVIACVSWYFLVVHLADFDKWKSKVIGAKGSSNQKDAWINSLSEWFYTHKGKVWATFFNKKWTFYYCSKR